MSSLPIRKPRNEAPPAPQAAPIARSVVLADQDVVIPASAHTLAGFRAWAISEDFPERGRISFLDEVISIDMSQEEIETHVKLKTEMTYSLVGLNKKLKRGEFYGDGVLVSNETANLSSIPDAVFILWASLESGRVRLVPREGVEGQYMEVEGTPDWVLEIVSRYSVQKDTKLLRRLYHRAGIPECWLIDARGEEVDFRILVRAETDYESAEERGGWQTSPIFERRFRLKRERGRMNFWEYTLQIKPLR